jgi:DNA polymerase bacteriophage-type
MGVDSFTKQWQEQFAHGGVLLENIVQGTARDILADAIVRVEQSGYPVVLHVHDEIVTEPKSNFGSIGEFSKIMSVVPAWAEGLPIAAAGWEGERYRKA